MSPFPSRSRSGFAFYGIAERSSLDCYYCQLQQTYDLKLTDRSLSHLKSMHGRQLQESSATRAYLARLSHA